MSFPKARVKRFNDTESCAPPVGAYDPKRQEKVHNVVIEKENRFKDFSDTVSPFVTPLTHSVSDWSLNSISTIPAACLYRSSTPYKKKPDVKTKKPPTGIDSSKVKQLEAEIKKLLRERTDTEKKLHIKEDELQKLESKLQLTLREKTATETKLISLEKELVALEKANEILKNKLSNNNNAAEKSKLIQQEISSLKFELSKKDKEILDLGKQLEKNQSYFESQLKQRGIKLEQLLSAKNQLDSFLKENQEQLSDLTSKLQKSNEKQEKFENLQEELHETTKKIQHLEDEGKKEVGEITRQLTTAQEQSRNELMKNEKKLNNIMKKLQSISLEEFNKDDLIRHLKGEVFTAKDELLQEKDELIRTCFVTTDLEEQIQEHKRTEQLLEERLRSSTNKYQLLEANLEKDQKIMKENEERIMKELDVVKRENVEAKKQLESLEQGKADLVYQLEETIVKLQRSEDSNMCYISTNNDLKQKTQQLEEERKRLKEENTVLLEKCNTQETLLVEIQKKLDDSEETMIQVTQTNQGLKEDFISVENNLSDCKLENSKLMLENKELTQNEKQLLVKLTAVDSEKISLQERMHENLMEYEQSLSAKEGIIISLQVELKECEEKLRDNSEQLNIKLNELDVSELHLRELQQKVENDSNTMEDITGQLKTQRNQNVTLEERICTLKLENEKLDCNYKKLESKCVQLEQINENNEVLNKKFKLEKIEELANKNSTIAELEKVIDQLRIKEEKVTEDWKMCKSKCANLEETLKKISEECDSVNERNKHLSQENILLQTQEHKLQESLKNLEHHSKQMEKESHNNKGKWENIERQLTQNINIAIEKNKNLETEVSKLKIDYKNCSSENSKIRFESAALQKELETQKSGCLEQEQVIKEIKSEKITLLKIIEEQKVEIAECIESRRRTMEELQQQLINNKKEYELTIEENLKILESERLKYGEKIEILQDKKEEEQDVQILHEEISKWKDLYEALHKKVGPFEEQLEAFMVEKEALVGRSTYAQKEVDKLGQKYAQLLGHQNQKQKIKHVLKLKEENISLQKELVTQKEKSNKQTRELKKLEEKLLKYECGKESEKSFDPKKAFKHGKENAPLASKR